MKAAILADIHGNSLALRAALADARSAGAVHLLVLGDLVGYYYDIASVLDQLTEWPYTAIGGNHEYMLGQACADEKAAAAYRAKYGSALDVARQTLPADRLDWLTQLPSRMTLEMAGVTFELCHGSPDDRDRYVYPNANEIELKTCEIAGRIVLMGHTHYPMVSVRKDCTLLNPGSVGQARDLGGFAAWMLFDTSTRTVAPRRSAYDTSALAAEVRRRDPQLNYLSDILHRNRLAATP